MIRVILAIATAVLAEVLMQLIQQDRKNMADKKAAQDEFRRINSLHDQAKAKCSKQLDKIRALEQKMDQLHPYLYDEHKALHDKYMDQWRKEKAIFNQLDGEAQYLLGELMKAGSNWRKVKELTISLSRLVPRVTSLLGRVAGIISGLITANELLQWGKEKLDQIRSERQALQDALNKEKSQCSGTAPGSQTLNIIQNAIQNI
jgi:hypothetical protein